VTSLRIIRGQAVWAYLNDPAFPDGPGMSPWRRLCEGELVVLVRYEDVFMRVLCPRLGIVWVPTYFESMVASVQSSAPVG